MSALEPKYIRTTKNSSREGRSKNNDLLDKDFLAALKRSCKEQSQAQKATKEASGSPRKVKMAASDKIAKKKKKKGFLKGKSKKKSSSNQPSGSRNEKEADQTPSSAKQEATKTKEAEKSDQPQ